MSYFMGVDPGVSGGIAIINDFRVPIVVMGMPETYIEILDVILIQPQTGCDRYCVLEKPTGYLPPRGQRKDGGEFKHGGQPGHRMFQFGKNCGAVEMAIVAGGFVEDETYHGIQPGVWMRALGLRTREKGETDTLWKNYLKEVAQELFPTVQVTKKTSDALLLAEYCFRTYGR